MRKKVLISVPNEHWIHKTVVERMFRLMRDTKGHQLKIIMPSHRPYENNLHHIVNDVLEGGHDFWLNIDADNPPERNPLELVALNKDVIGCPTPITHFDGKGSGDSPVLWNAFDYCPEHDSYKPHRTMRGLRKVDVVGTGCVLFSRRVFEHPEMQKGCFTRKLNKDGTVDRGNDFSFCERARENGFEIYAHYDYFCGHFSEMEINEMVKHFREFIDKQKVMEET